MSVLSESYHLETESQQAGVELLRAADVSGFVFPPENGWVSVIPDESDQPLAPISRFSQGTLLHLLHADGRGWVFELFEDGVPTSSYLCRWGGLLVVDDRRLDLERIVRLAVRRGQDPDKARRELQRIFHPTDHLVLEDEEAENPAYLFATLIGLYNFGWDASRDVVYDLTLLETAGVTRVA